MAYADHEACLVGDAGLVFLMVLRTLAWGCGDHVDGTPRTESHQILSTEALDVVLGLVEADSPTLSQRAHWAAEGMRSAHPRNLPGWKQAVLPRVVAQEVVEEHHLPELDRAGSLP
jgi:hypothetical protein